MKISWSLFLLVLLGCGHNLSEPRRVPVEVLRADQEMLMIQAMKAGQTFGDAEAGVTGGHSLLRELSERALVAYPDGEYWRIGWRAWGGGTRYASMLDRPESVNGCPEFRAGDGYRSGWFLYHCAPAGLEKELVHNSPCCPAGPCDSKLTALEAPGTFLCEPPPIEEE